ncbi:MAG: uridine kinase [Candidatus Woesearchaeota archaeon]|nr:uridine kinase [Candidatus Woesearchaeota archaeon]
MNYEFKQGLDIIKKQIHSHNKPVIIGISGRSCSGKTTFSNKLGFLTLSLDDYYFGIDKVQSMDFDNPNSIDFNLLRANILDLKTKKAIKKPKYNFSLHQRVGMEEVKPEDIIIVEGLFALNEFITDLIDIKVFIVCNEHKCLERRIIRDQKDRGRSRESIIQQYMKFVKPGYEKFIFPTIKDAIIIENN